jgi:hypothetical protein
MSLSPYGQFSSKSRHGSVDVTRGPPDVQVLVYEAGMHPLTLHQGLLGRDPQHTPPRYHVTPSQGSLYDIYPKAHGIAQTKEDPSLFLATLILVLVQTDYRKSRHVLLFIPKSVRPFVVSQVEDVFRYAVRCRKGDIANLKVLKDAFEQVSLSHQFLQIPKEPDYWAAFGLGRNSALPDWLNQKLVDETDLR